MDFRIKSNQIKSRNESQIKSNQIKSRIKSNQIKSNPIKQNRDKRSKIEKRSIFLIFLYINKASAKYKLLKFQQHYNQREKRGLMRRQMYQSCIFLIYEVCHIVL